MREYGIGEYGTRKTFVSRQSVNKLPPRVSLSEKLEDRVTRIDLRSLFKNHHTYVNYFKLSRGPTATTSVTDATDR